MAAAAAAARGIPPAALLELRRVACLPSPWVVADMDSTLIRKAPGEWPGLDTSPVRPHLFAWLESGGALLVITSDDGHRPWRQLLGQIPETLRGNVLLSTADGAALSRPGPDGGTFTEDLHYWRTANNGEPAGLPSPAAVVEVACDIKRDFLVAAMGDTSLLATVTPDWRMEGYADILAKFTTEAELREYLTTERMLGMSAVMKRGSLVWRNQAGAPDFWEVQDDAEWRAKRNAKLATQAAQADTASGAATPPAPTRWTNCFVLGMSSAVSAPYLERHGPRLAALGAVASAAPNSVLIKHRATDKSLPLKWLARRQPDAAAAAAGCSGGFRFSTAVAFGDNPSGNDAPLASFIEQGMPFISVAPSIDKCQLPTHPACPPPPFLAVHVCVCACVCVCVHVCVCMCVVVASLNGPVLVPPPPLTTPTHPHTPTHAPPRVGRVRVRPWQRATPTQPTSPATCAPSLPQARRLCGSGTSVAWRKAPPSRLHF